MLAERESLNLASVALTITCLIRVTVSVEVRTIVLMCGTKLSLGRLVKDVRGRGREYVIPLRAYRLYRWRVEDCNLSLD